MRRFARRDCPRPADALPRADIRYQRYQKCISQNPKCYWGPRELLFYIAEHLAWTAAPSSDAATGLPGPPTYDVVSKFWGVATAPNGTYYAVPGQLPSNPWYRRSVPVTIVQGALAGSAAYAAHPVLFGGNQGAVNTFTPE